MKIEELYYSKLATKQDDGRKQEDFIQEENARIILEMFRDSFKYENFSKSKRKSFDINKRLGIKFPDEITKMNERQLESYFFKSKKENPIGTFILYQVARKERKGEYLESEKDKFRGPIDLLAVKGEDLIVVELKDYDNNENLIRAALEAYTYSAQFDLDLFKADFCSKKTKKCDMEKELVKNVKQIKPVVLIPKKDEGCVKCQGKAYRTALNAKNGKSPNIKELIKNVLGVEIYTFDKTGTIEQVVL